MEILWPGFLLFLGLIPLLVGVYIWMLRRRRRFAVRYSSLALIREALPQPSRLRRHLPFALFVLALTSLVIALARPAASVSAPTGRTTIILAMDVSRSMCATDISPNRLEVAKSAALSFIQDQSSNTQIGIVAFAGFAELIQPPTTDQEVLQDAVAGLTTARRTAVGSAILKSLDAIAEVDKNVAPSVIETSSELNQRRCLKASIRPTLLFCSPTEPAIRVLYRWMRPNKQLTGACGFIPLALVQKMGQTPCRRAGDSFRGAHPLTAASNLAVEWALAADFGGALMRTR